MTMLLFHRIGDRKFGSNFNTLRELLNLNHRTQISFDGVYSEVWQHREALRSFKDITLFVMGEYVGKDNSFDTGQPPGKLITWDQVNALRSNYGFKIGYHTWSHRDLTQLSDEEVRKEVTPPFLIERFAYPMGRVDERVAKIVEQCGYTEAWAAGEHGDGSQFQRKRNYLGW